MKQLLTVFCLKNAIRKVGKKACDVIHSYTFGNWVLRLTDRLAISSRLKNEKILTPPSSKLSFCSALKIYSFVKQNPVNELLFTYNVCAVPKYWIACEDMLPCFASLQFDWFRLVPMWVNFITLRYSFGQELCNLNFVQRMGNLFQYK